MLQSDPEPNPVFFASTVLCTNECTDTQSNISFYCTDLCHLTFFFLAIFKNVLCQKSCSFWFINPNFYLGEEKMFSKVTFQRKRNRRVKIHRVTENVNSLRSFKRQLLAWNFLKILIEWNDSVMLKVVVAFRKLSLVEVFAYFGTRNCSKQKAYIYVGGGHIFV